MKITLRRKNDESHKDPMLVQYVRELATGKRQKITVTVTVGQTIDLPADIAYDVMSKYKGCFEPGEDTGEVSEKAKSNAYKNKAAESPAAEKVSV